MSGAVLLEGLLAARTLEVAALAIRMVVLVAGAVVVAVSLAKVSTIIASIAVAVIAVVTILVTSSSSAGEITASGAPPLVARGAGGLDAPLLVLAFLENASEGTIPHVRSVVLQECVLEGDEVGLDLVVLPGVIFLMCLWHAKKVSLHEVVRSQRRQLRAEQTGVEIIQHGRLTSEVVLGRHPCWLLPQAEPADDGIARVLRTRKLTAVADATLLKLVKSQGG
jgi:hypothetical protein